MHNDATTTLQMLKERADKFATDRDWVKFHNPKDMTMDLVREATELMELMLWKTPEQIAVQLAQDPAYKERLREEFGDVVHALARLSSLLEFDIAQAFYDKMAKTEKKYPVDQVHGRLVKR